MSTVGFEASDLAVRIAHNLDLAFADVLRDVRVGSQRGWRWREGLIADALRDLAARPDRPAPTPEYRRLRTRLDEHLEACRAKAALIGSPSRWRTGARYVALLDSMTTEVRRLDEAMGGQPNPEGSADG